MRERSMARAMEMQFQTVEWLSLPSRERARRCRLWASEVQSLADRASKETSLYYRRIAREWLHLADEIEARSTSLKLMEPNST